MLLKSKDTLKKLIAIQKIQFQSIIEVGYIINKKNIKKQSKIIQKR